MPERMFWMPPDMPERISEYMPDRVPERMSEDMPEKMSEDMPDRMSEDMLDMRDRWGGREKMMLLFGVLRPGCVFRYFFPELWGM